jgi:pilus assembly protein CpaF
MNPDHSRLNSLLKDPKITDICFNRYQEIFIDRGFGMELWQDAGHCFSSEIDYRNFILEQLSKSGKTWDAKLPFVDTVFFGTHRAHIAFPPLAQSGIYLSLRKLPIRQTLSALPASELGPIVKEHQAAAELRWTESGEGFEILKKSIFCSETVLIAGGTGSGKTTLLNDLLGFVPITERILCLEDTAEIAPLHPHFVSLLSRTANADGIGAVTPRDLLRQTLRMRPDRIILGECRGDEVLDLLQALNTGHRGTLCTLHANHPRDALKRIELLALLGAKGTLPASLIRELMAAGIRKVAHLERVDGVRKIQSIFQLEGKEGETLVGRTVFDRTGNPSRKYPHFSADHGR